MLSLSENLLDQCHLLNASFSVVAADGRVNGLCASFLLAPGHLVQYPPVRHFHCVALIHLALLLPEASLLGAWVISLQNLVIDISSLSQKVDSRKTLLRPDKRDFGRAKEIA